MKYKVAFFLAIFICNGFTKQNVGQEKRQCFIVPNDISLAVVAYQPNSPIEFIKTPIVCFLDGGSIGIYQLQNRSSKPIRSYTVATITSVGTGYETNFQVTKKENYFMPGKRRPEAMEDWGYDFVSLTEELRSKYHINGNLKDITIFFVIRVEFADGDVFNAKSEYESLKRFISKNAFLSDKKETEVR